MNNVCEKNEAGKRGKFIRHRRDMPKNIKVVNTVLLYSIVDAGFLHTHLLSVHKDEEGKKAFYFKRCPEIHDMVNGFDFNAWSDYEAYTRDDYSLSEEQLK